MSLDMWVYSLRLVGDRLKETAAMEASFWYSEVLEEAGASAPPNAQLCWFSRDHQFIVAPDRVPDLLDELRALDVSSRRFPHAPSGCVDRIQRDHRAVTSFVEHVITREDYVLLSAAPQTW